MPVLISTSNKILSSYIYLQKLPPPFFLASFPTDPPSSRQCCLFVVPWNHQTLVLPPDLYIIPFPKVPNPRRLPLSTLHEQQLFLTLLNFLSLLYFFNNAMPSWYTRCLFVYHLSHLTKIEDSGSQSFSLLVEVSTSTHGLLGVH